MALVRRLEQKSMERNAVHDEVDATFTAFERDGRVFVQIDTYGWPGRELAGKKSQTCSSTLGCATAFRTAEEVISFLMHRVRGVMT